MNLYRSAKSYLVAIMYSLTNKSATARGIIVNALRLVRIGSVTPQRNMGDVLRMITIYDTSALCVWGNPPLVCKFYLSSLEVTMLHLEIPW